MKYGKMSFFGVKYHFVTI